MTSISHCVLALLRFLVSIGAPVFSILGILVSVYGTYLITRFFHGMPKWEFAKSAMYIAWVYIWRRSDEGKALVGSGKIWGKVRLGRQTGHVGWCLRRIRRIGPARCRRCAVGSRCSVALGQVSFLAFSMGNSATIIAVVGGRYTLRYTFNGKRHEDSVRLRDGVPLAG